MVKLTASLEKYLMDNHPAMVPLLFFGHTELLTKEIYLDYLKWCGTDEAREYFPGGAHYHDPR